jgi:predicted RNase H-like HicB family nuclease
MCDLHSAYATIARSYECTNNRGWKPIESPSPGVVTSIQPRKLAEGVTHPEHKCTILIHPGDANEAGYWVEVPALPGCFTQGQTIEECQERAEDAVRRYVEGLIEEGHPVPEEPRREGAPVSEVELKLQAPAWAGGGRLSTDGR